MSQDFVSDTVTGTTNVKQDNINSRNNELTLILVHLPLLVIYLRGDYIMMRLMIKCGFIMELHGKT